MANTSEEFVNSTLEQNVGYCSNKNSYGIHFFYSIMTLCFLLGTPAHLWCFWIYFGTEKKIRESQVFVLNHTIMDIIYCLECGMETLSMYVFNNYILWHVSLFFYGLSWTGRPLLQICICIEQYLAVIHPVTFLRHKDIKYRIAAVVAAWLIAFAYGVYVSITLVSLDYFYTFVFITAMAVVLFCCVSVLCALKQSGPGDKQITKQTGRDGGNQQKRNAFNTIFSALLLILFTYLPQALIIIFFDPKVSDSLFIYCTMIFLMTSLNIFGVIITPFLKLYKDSHKKMSNVSKGN